MILLLVSFGLKIKSLLELEKLWWLRNASNNWLLLKSTTFTVTMESSMLNSLLKTARTSSRLSHFLELVLTIRMHLLSGQFKPSCTWPEPLWFMFLCIGANLVLIILLCGIFAVKHAVWLHNHVSNHLYSLTPLDLITKAKASHCDLLHTCVWGCPVYVLDPKL